MLTIKPFYLPLLYSTYSTYIMEKKCVRLFCSTNMTDQAVTKDECMLKRRRVFINAVFTSSSFQYESHSLRTALGKVSL